MGRVLKNYQFVTYDSEAKRRGQSWIYPWEKWFDGRIWKLTKGVDFLIPCESFRTMSYKTAKRKGKRLRTNFDTTSAETATAVVLQAFSRDGE